MRLDTWVSYDVAYGQPLPWRCAWRRGTALKSWNHGMHMDGYEWRYYCAGKSLLTHFVMKHHHYSAGTRKKRPASQVFFSYRPSAGAAPWSVPTQQTVYVVAPTLQLLTSSLAKPFLSNTIDRQGMASLQSNCTFSFKHHLTIADHFPSKTFSFKHHLTGEAWPACRAILPFHHTQNVCKLT